MNVETMRILVAKGLSASDLLEVAEAMAVHSDRSWMKPKRALPGGQYLLDRWGACCP